jgi:hypothetical protein
LDDYKKAIKFYADHNENFEFGNKNAEHASIVISQLFQFAKEEILIYSGTLNSQVTNNSHLIKQVNKYLESGGKLRLILDQLPEKDARSEVLKQIIQSVNNTSRDVKYKVDTNNNFSQSLSALFSDKKAHHFMVADNVAYRIETDKDKYEAFGNFNDTKVAMLFSQKFIEFIKD